MKDVDAILDGASLLGPSRDGTTALPDAPVPSEASVLAALQRIAASKGFDAPDRSRRFLEFIVREVLAGRGARIKAYTIATEVFGRPPNFDPQKDPIVRIEAARLRRALEHYYLTDGLHDTLTIDIPKGGYLPAFAVRETQAVTGAPGLPRAETVALGGAPGRWLLAAFVILTVMASLYLAFKPTVWTSEEPAASAQDPVHAPGVIIKPLADLTKAQGSDLLALGLTERIIEKTSRFRDLTVIASDGGSAKPSVLAARYEFGGTVRTIDGKLVVQTRLVDRSDGRVLWADNLETLMKARQLFDVEAEIANQIATKIGEPNGIIFKADRRMANDKPPENWDAYLCMLHAYAYRATFAAREFDSVRACLEGAVAAYPGFATAWALLSLTYVDEFRFFFPAPPDNAVPALTRAHDAAMRAIELDPTNIRGQQALMMTLFFRKDYEPAIAVGRAALSLNPNDTEFKGEFGYRLAIYGRWEEGCKLVGAALAASARKIGYHKTAMALCHYFRNDTQAAADLIIEAAAVDNPGYHFMAAGMLAEAGRTAEAADSRRWLEQNAPEELQVFLKEFTERIIQPEDRAKFIASLRKAGFDIPG